MKKTSAKTKKPSRRSTDSYGQSRSMNKRLKAQGKKLPPGLMLNSAFDLIPKMTVVKLRDDESNPVAAPCAIAGSCQYAHAPTDLLSLAIKNAAISRDLNPHDSTYWAGKLDGLHEALHLFDSNLKTPTTTPTTDPQN